MKIIRGGYYVHNNNEIRCPHCGGPMTLLRWPSVLKQSTEYYGWCNLCQIHEYCPAKSYAGAKKYFKETLNLEIQKGYVK